MCWRQTPATNLERLNALEGSKFDTLENKVAGYILLQVMGEAYCNISLPTKRQQTLAEVNMTGLV